jgi:N-acyl-D-amino-acid deacylase
MRAFAFGLICLGLAACQVTSQKTSEYDLIIRHGIVYDGSGAPQRQADVGVRGQRVAAIGDLARAHAVTEVDANGLAVAPGFVNMLSWAPDSLYLDGRSSSDIRQGVMLEVFGEGDSLGPLTAEIRATDLCEVTHRMCWAR